MNAPQKAKLTGLWKNKGKDGKTYLSGSLGVSALMIYPNGFKRSDKDPDYVAYLVQKGRKAAANDTVADDDDL